MGYDIYHIHRCNILEVRPCINICSLQHWCPSPLGCASTALVSLPPWLRLYSTGVPPPLVEPLQHRCPKPRWENFSVTFEVAQTCQSIMLCRELTRANKVGS